MVDGLVGASRRGKPCGSGLTGTQNAHFLFAFPSRPSHNPPVGSLNYQRTILAYHGCDRTVAESVLLGRSRLEASHNDYDWLGAGLYFWEYGPQRALEWAAGIAKRRPHQLKEPAVIGAIIHLGVCFDLLDVRFTDKLADIYPDFEQTLRKAGQPVPQNEPAH
jgi:hypothetical protein